MNVVDRINKSVVARQKGAYADLVGSRGASGLTGVVQLALRASSELYEERLVRKTKQKFTSAGDVANRMARLVISRAIAQQNSSDSEDEGESIGVEQEDLLSSDAAIKFAQLLYEQHHSESGYESVSKVDVPPRCAQGLIGNIVYTRGVNFLLKRSRLGEQLLWDTGKGRVKGRLGVSVIMSDEEGIAIMQPRATKTTMSELIGQKAKDAGPISSKWWRNNSLPLGELFPVMPTPVSVDIIRPDTTNESTLTKQLGRGFTVDDCVYVPHHHTRGLHRVDGVEGVFADAFRLFMIKSCIATSVQSVMSAAHTDSADAERTYTLYTENGWLSPLLSIYNQDATGTTDEYRVIATDVPLSLEEVIGEIGVCFERTISIVTGVAENGTYDVRTMLRNWDETFSDLSRQSDGYGRAMETTRNEVATTWTNSSIRKKLVTAVFDVWNNSLEAPIPRSWCKQLCKWMSTEAGGVSPYRRLPVHGLKWVIEAGVTTLAMSDAMVYLLSQGKWAIEDDITAAICAALQSQRLMRCMTIFATLSRCAWVSRVTATVFGREEIDYGEIASESPVGVPVYTPEVMHALETSWHLHTRGREFLYNRISSEAATHIPFQGNECETLRLNIGSSLASDLGTSLTFRWVFVLPRDVCKWNIVVGYSGIPGVDGVTEEFSDWGFYTETVNDLNPAPSNTHTELLVDVTFVIKSRVTEQVGHSSYLMFKGSCVFTSGAKSVEFEDKSTTNIIFTPTNPVNSNYVLEVDTVLCTPRTVVVGPNT